MFISMMIMFIRLVAIIYPHYMWLLSHQYEPYNNICMNEPLYSCIVPTSNPLVNSTMSGLNREVEYLVK